MLNLKKIRDNKQNKESKKIVIIDGSNILIRAFSITQKYQQNLYAYFLKDVSNIITKFKPSVCYIVFDGQGNSNAKKKLYAQYKANRGHVSKIQTDDFKNLFQLLKQLPLIVVRKNNIQGDNVISHLKQINKNKDIIICSSDKDFYQLIDQNTRIYDMIKKIVIDTKFVINNFNCHPKNFILFKCLMGDASDNIPGIKGLGPKTIQKILPQILKQEQPLNGDINNLIQYLKTIEGTNKNVTKILEQSQNLIIFEKLMSLQNGASLNPQIGSQITQSVNHRLKNVRLDLKEFTNLANKHGFKKQELGVIFSGMRLLQTYKLTS